MARVHIEWLTGGDISPTAAGFDQERQQNYLWLRGDNESVGAALLRNPIKVPTVSEAQGEAICWDKTGTDYYTISEGGSAAVNYFKSPTAQVAVIPAGNRRKPQIRRPAPTACRLTSS